MGFIISLCLNLCIFCYISLLLLSCLFLFLSIFLLSPAFAFHNPYLLMLQSPIRFCYNNTFLSLYRTNPYFSIRFFSIQHCFTELFLFLSLNLVSYLTSLLYPVWSLIFSLPSSLCITYLGVQKSSLNIHLTQSNIIFSSSFLDKLLYIVNCVKTWQQLKAVDTRRVALTIQSALQEKRQQ